MKTQLANRNMEQLVVKSVVKRFGEHTVLQSFDLTVAKGQFVALLGPSGCGKSTLLRIIAGLETPNGGDVLIAGRNVTELAPEDRNIALMFQSYALLPHMTVLENVRFPLRMRSNLSRAEQEKRSMEALALVKLDPFSSRYPRQLSGGQQQRVALARSIVAEPDLLLLDEPLSNLDARLREDMQIELKRLHEELGLTTIFVTHDQDEALGLADTVILMNGGRIEQQDRRGDRPDQRAGGRTGDRELDGGGPSPAGRAERVDEGTDHRGAPEREPDLAGRPGDVEHGEPDDHRQRGARVHAEQPRVGQGVAGEALHDGAGQAQGPADHQRQHRPGQAQLADDEVVLDPRVVGAEGLEGRGPGHRLGTHRERQHPGQDHHADEHEQTGAQRGTSAHRQSARASRDRRAHHQLTHEWLLGVPITR